MDKKRDRIVNAQPFIIDDASVERSPITAVFSAASALNTEEEKRVFEEEEDDIDHFYGNFDDDSYQGDVNEEDEKLFESFFVKNALPRRTLAYILIKKIKDNDAELAEEERHDPQMDPMIAKLYKGVANLMSEYTIGKMPSAFVRTKMAKKRDRIVNAQPFITDDASVEERHDPQMDPLIAKLYNSVAKLMSEYTVGKMPRAFVRTTMAKKQDRIVNAQPFINDDASVGSSRKRSKLLEADISYKIIKVALAQQKEIANEENAERNPITAVFSAASALNAEEEKRVIEEEEDDIDVFDGKFDDDSYQEDEKLFESFCVKNAPPQRTLADILIKKIKDNDAELAEEEHPDPQMDPMIAKLYKGVVKLMIEYTVGKMPRAFVKKTMSKKREGIVNAQPFITNDASVGTSRKQSNVQKTNQQQDKIIDEENAERNPITIVFSAASTLNAEEEKRVIEAEEDDIDDFDGKFDDDSYQSDVNEEDEKLFDSFFVKNTPPQYTLADIIIKKIKDNDAELAEEERHDPEMVPMIAKLYKGVAKLMSDGWENSKIICADHKCSFFIHLVYRENEPFITDDAFVGSSRKRAKVPKTHQQLDKLLEAGISSKIMKVALCQQKAISDEENVETNSNTALWDVNEEDEKLFDSFFVKKAPPQRTLVDIIIKKIKDNDDELAEKERSDPQMDPMIAKLCKGVAKLMSEYTVGKMPRAFVRTKMAKKRDRIVNAQPFITDDASVGSSRKRSKVPKIHQQQNKLLEVGISSNIMKVALGQQKEIAEDENAEWNSITVVFSAASDLNTEEEKRVI
ncbi:hypothetical protein F2Q69_00053987 [Brassica cretica]|uniref:Uncharacterized protein n=1 Tax=Brassica cretica TaxID=69181 RepID=A0A8S9MWB8_BRACR|nr:hypothetical protein F2Q69_00053987 [Brassica cretica]